MGIVRLERCVHASVLAGHIFKLMVLINGCQVGTVHNFFGVPALLNNVDVMHTSTVWP